jgi:hypothetical protein
MAIEDLFAPPQPGDYGTGRIPRPPPLRPLPPRWRRNALAAAVILGVGAGVFLTLAPARGWVNWDWLQRLTHPGDAQTSGETMPGTGGSPLPETRSALPAAPPSAPIPETEAAAATATEEVEPERAAEDVPRAAGPGKVRTMKARRYTERRAARRGATKLRPDSATEVLLF